MGLLSGVDDLEHLLLADAADLGQGDGELGGLLGALVLDGAAEGLGLGGVGSVEQVVGQRGLGVVLGGGLHVALLVGLDLFAHLDLLLVPLRLVQLRAQAAQVLRVLGGLVPLAGLALARPLLVVETSAMCLAETLHVLILRLFVDIGVSYYYLVWGGEWMMDEGCYHDEWILPSRGTWD